GLARAFANGPPRARTKRKTNAKEERNLNKHKRKKKKQQPPANSWQRTSVHDHNFGVHDVIPLFTPHQNQRSRSSESARICSASSWYADSRLMGMSSRSLANPISSVMQRLSRARS